MTDRGYVEVRDRRRQSMFRVDDAFIDDFARKCGTAATAVYFSLCRHSNGNQESFPSIELIAKQHGIGKSTVIRAIRKLERFRLIEVIRRKDTVSKRQKPNIYLLLDRVMWTSRPSPKMTPGSRVLLGAKSRVSSQDRNVSLTEKEKKKPFLEVIGMSREQYRKLPTQTKIDLMRQWSSGASQSPVKAA